MNTIRKLLNLLQPTGALFNLAWLRSLLPHSQTALQGSDFCSVCARDLSVAAAVFHAGWVMSGGSYGSRLPPPPPPTPTQQFLTPSSGSRNNCIVPSEPGPTGLTKERVCQLAGLDEMMACVWLVVQKHVALLTLWVWCVFLKALLKKKKRKNSLFLVQTSALYTNKCLRSKSQPCVYTVLKELFGMDVRCFIYCFNFNGIINCSCRLYYPESAYINHG